MAHKPDLLKKNLPDLRAIAVAEYERHLGPAGQYVHITFKEGGTGRTRRSFALAPECATGTRHLVVYRLLTKDAEEKGESVIGFATDSSIVVRPARMDNHYGELEVLR